jgi:hypothetical protein
MPRSKKKEADTLRRKNRAILFGVIDAIALLIVYLVYKTLNGSLPLVI